MIARQLAIALAVAAVSCADPRKPGSDVADDSPANPGTANKPAADCLTPQTPTGCKVVLPDLTSLHAKETPQSHVASHQIIGASLADLRQAFGARLGEIDAKDSDNEPTGDKRTALRLPATELCQDSGELELELDGDRVVRARVQKCCSSDPQCSAALEALKATGWDVVLSPR